MFARAAQRRLFLTGSSDVSAAARSFSSTAPARADFTHVVIGGGVIGLATARALQTSPPPSSTTPHTTLLLEQHAQLGTETSSRNSEVIHGGLYYGPASLKTRLCITGRRALYAFCAAHGVGCARTGKWIVAQTAGEHAALSALHETCRDELGVPTRWVGRAEAARLEPEVRADAGVLESPETGIVDSHGLMTALQGLFEEAGGAVAVRSRVVGISPIPSPNPSSHSLPGSAGWTLTVEDSGTHETSTITTDILINCAGLGAAEIHNLIAPPERQKRLYYAKGTYFSYGASSPRVSRLIYPVTAPGAGGLGTHLTLDLGGRVRFGPDVEWVSTPSDVRASAARLPQALEAIRRYLPGVDAGALAPDYAGIRPKLGRDGAVASGKGFVDFYIRREDGFEGWVNLLGIESPGLTSSLAIGDYVRDLLYGSRKVDEGSVA
ncbi:FAD dependent oxidoreductase [Whalleya microplaca]|nr:FAD dependent oxidoreductase [Whalleya microplaca]